MLQPLPQISTLAIGSELLDGRLCDSNSQWIANELKAYGLKLNKTIIVPDEVSSICAALELLWKESDSLIVSGGLGPTSDDITRNAIAKFFDLELTLNQPALDGIKAYFEKRGREFLKSNEQQAMFPKGATVISNPVGTAPAFLLQDTNSNKRLFCLPGVPLELKPIFKNSVLEQVISGFKSEAATGVLRVFSEPESKLELAIQSCNFGPEIKLGYRAHFPEIQISFCVDSKDRESNQELLSEALNKAENAIGSKSIYSKSYDIEMEQSVAQLLLAQKQTLAVAESCTGGMLGMYFTRLSGSSAFFQGGVISYSNKCKESILGVPAKLIEGHGAVSAEVAEAMAEGVRQRCNSDLALSITGIAGPQGGSDEKPVGTFYVGLASSKEVLAKHFFFPAGREKVRQYACYSAMNWLRCWMVG